MASIAIMIGGAILNATTFVGGSYLAKYLSGNSVDPERIRHDKALEKYQHDYEVYQENKEEFAAWQEQRRENEGRANQNMANTDEALKIYNQLHRDPISLDEPRFTDYYRPGKDQKMGEMASQSGNQPTQHSSPVLMITIR